MPKLAQVAKHTWAGGGVGMYVSGTWIDWGQRPEDGEWNRVGATCLISVALGSHITVYMLI